MKKLLLLLLPLLPFLSYGKSKYQCPDKVECNSSQVILTYNSSPTNKAIDRLELKINGKYKCLLIDSIVGSKYYFKNNGIDCSQTSSRYNLRKGKHTKVRCCASQPLPVELTEFYVVRFDNINLIKWETASELNNKGFEVQKSFNNKDWELIFFQEGKGTSNEFNSYEILDNTDLTSYYRLKQIDFDGVYEYSNTIVMTVKERVIIRERIMTPKGILLNKRERGAIVIIEYSDGTHIRQLVL